MVSLAGSLSGTHVALPFLGGVLLSLVLPAPLPAYALWMVLAAALACGGVRPLRAASWAGAGVLCCQVALADHLTRIQTTDERYLVQARVLGIPAHDAGGLEFDARITFERVRRPALRARLRVRRAADAPVAAGDTWQLAVRLRPPRAAANPGAVDTERNLLRDHVHALGEVLASPLNRRLARCAGCLDARRAQLAEWIAARVADRDSAALLAALAVGATGDVSREQWRVFNATGITHLIAISGMHVTLFAWVAMAAARRLWRPVASLWLRWGRAPRRETFAAVLGIACAAGYSLMAGFSVPTQRTLIMLSAWLAWLAAARAAPLSQALGVALLLVLAGDPFAALSAGFWLSFGAVAAIFLMCAGRAQRMPALREALRVQLGVTAALLPATFAAFGSVSLAGLVVNLAAIPLVSFVLVPVVLAAGVLQLLAQGLGAAWLSPFASLLLQVGAWIHARCWPALAFAADAAPALWRVTPGAGWYALAIPAVLVALVPWPPRLRLAALALPLMLLLPASTAPPPGGLQATILDVGQGTAVILRSAAHTLVYGTGESFGSEGGGAERSVLPLLRGQHVDRVDLLVLPRLDRDAARGALALQAAVPVRAIFIGGTPVASLPGAQPCAGQRWEWDGVRFELLAPPGEAGDAGVARACVLRAQAATGSLLLPGDIDAGQEQLLVTTQAPLASELVVVPRHAAATGSSTAFIQAVRARYAVAVVRGGARGASLQAVRSRWQAAGARFLDTGSSGAVSFDIDPRRGVRAPRAARAAASGVWRMP